MNVLITGLNNYIARNIAVFLAEEDYGVTCLVRGKKFFYEHVPEEHEITLLEWDLFRDADFKGVKKEIDVAFYFSQTPVNEPDIHMGMEILALERYLNVLKETDCRHFIYVTKLSDDRTERIQKHLFKAGFTYTIIRVSNIIGKGSLLMNIFSKLVKQKIVVFTKEFEVNRGQPVSLFDVCRLINCIMLDPSTFGRTYDIGGPEILTYRQMVERCLAIAKLNKRAFKLPIYSTFLTTFVSQYLFRFESDISRALSANISRDLLCKHDGLASLYSIELTPFDESVRLALGMQDSGHFPLSKS